MSGQIVAHSGRNAGMIADPSASPEEAPERFELTWPGKREARRQAAEAPQGMLIADGWLGDEGEAEPLPLRSHRYIVGDNLAAMQLLLPELRGQVRLIYSDPPYNTGQRFAFADRFATSQQRNGQNYRRRGDALAPSVMPDLSGRQHAAWLSMLYPRLIVARELLREDGAIFISIGPEELHHLLCLMDEIFGEDCFKNIIVIRRGAKNVQAQFATVDALQHGHEYVVFFARSPTARFPKLLLPGADGEAARPYGTWNNHWRGTERPTMRYALFGITPERGQWRWGEARSQQAIANYEQCCAELSNEWPAQQAIDTWVARQHVATGARIDLLRRSLHGKPEHYVPPATGKLASDLWTDLAPNGSAQLRRIFGKVPLFETPKSLDLLRRLITFASAPGDLIMDCFAGTCTTAQAVLDQNAADGGERQFICIQSPDSLPAPITLADGTELRTIADIGWERIQRTCGNHTRVRRFRIGYSQGGGR